MGNPSGDHDERFNPELFETVFNALIQCGYNPPSDEKTVLANAPALTMAVSHLVRVFEGKESSLPGTGKLSDVEPGMGGLHPDVAKFLQLTGNLDGIPKAGRDLWMPGDPE